MEDPPIALAIASESLAKNGERRLKPAVGRSEGAAARRKTSRLVARQGAFPSIVNDSFRHVVKNPTTEKDDPKRTFITTVSNTHQCFIINKL
jgi:hypothetical protein